MKLYSSIFFCLLLIGCKKKNDSPGFITYVVNGVVMHGELNGASSPGIFINSHAFRGKGVPYMNLDIYAQANALRQPLYDGKLADSLNLGNVARATFDACDVFRIVQADSVNNYIQITGQSDDHREVWGVFSFTAVKDSNYSCSMKRNGYIPSDTAFVRNGMFYLKN
jgi:hypothetical protein